MMENYSLSDIAAATGNNRNNGNGSGFLNGDGSWFIIILFLFAFLGWGNGGWGGNNGGATPYMTSAATQSDIQRGFDNQAVISKLDGITNGLCDTTYAVTNAVNGGFANTNMNIMQMANGIERQLCNMQAQNQQCCCETQRLMERGFADTNYNLATQSCETRNLIQNAVRDIIENNNNNNRAMHDFLVQDKISSIQAENQTLKLAASQSAQNAYLAAMVDSQTAELIRRIAPAAVPAYVVPNPNCCCHNPCGCGM